MVLPEVVSRLVPVAAVGHLVALRHVVAVGILGEVSVSIVDERLVEGVILAKTYIIHIFIGLDTRFDAIGTVHQTHIIIACRHSVPGLSCPLEVADILIANLEVVAQKGQTAVVRTRATTGAVNETISMCFVVSTVENQTVP